MTTTAGLTPRKAYHGLDHPDGWQVTDTWQHGRTVLTRGRLLTITGGGRGAVYSFWSYTDTGDRQWITVLGGRPGYEMFREFRPDRIGRVLRGYRQDRAAAKGGRGR